MGRGKLWTVSVSPQAYDPDLQELPTTTQMKKAWKNNHDYPGEGQLQPLKLLQHYVEMTRKKKRGHPLAAADTPQAYDPQEPRSRTTQTKKARRSNDEYPGGCQLWPPKPQKQ